MERNIGEPRVVRSDLSTTYVLTPEGCAYFSSDASRFIYPTYQDDGTFSFKWVRLVDTSSLYERVYQFDGYRLDTGYWQGHYEWTLNANGTKAYLLCQKEKGGESNFLVLLELDLETGKKRALPRKGWRLVLSPNERQVAVLDGDTEDKKKALIQLNLVDVEMGVEARILRSFQKKDRGAPRRFLWLKPNLFAAAMEYAQGAFVFIDLKEGEGR